MSGLGRLNTPCGFTAPMRSDREPEPNPFEQEA